MVPLREIAGGLWTLLGFMIVASVVLNMRYKPVGDGTGYLDTWTGKTHQVAEVVAPAADEASETTARVEIEVMERVAERVQGQLSTLDGVRFAFPAPERHIVVVRRGIPTRVRFR